jgi:hypothetical protein
MHNMQHVALHANTCPMANVRGHRVLNIICQPLVGHMESKMNPRVRAKPNRGIPCMHSYDHHADSLSAHMHASQETRCPQCTAHTSNAWKQ